LLFVFPPFPSAWLLFLDLSTHLPLNLKFLRIRFDFPINLNLLSSQPTEAFNV
jgi:hypothetical protein